MSPQVSLEVGRLCVHFFTSLILTFVYPPLLWLGVDFETISSHTSLLWWWWWWGWGWRWRWRGGWRRRQDNDRPLIRWTGNHFNSFFHFYCWFFGLIKFLLLYPDADVHTSCHPLDSTFISFCWHFSFISCHHLLLFYCCDCLISNDGHDDVIVVVTGGQYLFHILVI